MLKQFSADLHMHTCLSPCAELDMTPREIVRVSLSRGLNIIAITDHNSAENAEAAIRAARGTGLEVLAGMEISTSEEAHILAFFENAECASRMQEIVFSNLPAEENDERLYGDQVVANEDDEVIGFNKRLLISSTKLRAKYLIDLIGSFGGLSIASHVDREAFSIVSQLGFIPADMKFDAVEMSAQISREKAESVFGDMKKFTWVSFSDAHHPVDIGKRVTTFTLNEPTFSEIRLALRNEDGRRADWS